MFAPKTNTITQPTLHIVAEPSASLRSASVTYQRMGYSIIPVYGVRSRVRTKQATVAWQKYQQRMPHATEIAQWLTSATTGGWAIITGRVSRLLVLDFDDDALARRFRDAFPQLCQTHIVTSAGRGLPHYYYRLPQDMRVPSLKLAGLDVLADGRYVIAPPTQMPGGAYTVAHDVDPLPLTHEDIQALYAWVHQQNPTKPKIQTISSTTSITSPDKAIARLQSYAQHLGSRNQAFFQLACELRDAGWSQMQIAHHVLPAFVGLSSLKGTTREKTTSRLREGQRTLASVFTRPPRRPVSLEVGAVLPHIAREAFLTKGETSGAQVLDALYLAQATTFTYSDLQRVYGFSAHTAKGGLAILRAYDLLQPPSTPESLIPTSSDEHIQQCLNIGVNKRPKIGRPAKVYAVPTHQAVCQALGVPYRPTKSAPETLNTQTTRKASAYRQAHLRDIIQRRAGAYQRDQLAQRLGVTRQTLARDLAGAGVQKQAQYVDMPLTWADVDTVDAHRADWQARRQENRPNEKRDVCGLFLQIDGRRYPPVTGIASKALAQGKQVTLRLQTVNHYSIAPAMVSPFGMLDSLITPSTPQKGWVAYHQADLQARHVGHQQVNNARKQAPKAGTLPETTLKAPLSSFDMTDVSPKPKRNRKTDRHYRVRERMYKKPLPSPAQERRAQAIVAQLNPHCERGRTISLTVAREVAHLCEWRNVDRALEATLALHAEGKVEHVVGYFLTVVHYGMMVRFYREGEKHGWSRERIQQEAKAHLKRMEAVRKGAKV
jgi:hypothetical protein